MATITLIKCDRCGNVVNNKEREWDQRTSHFELKVPSDGINGGEFKFDLCPPCRHIFHRILVRFVNDVDFDGSEPPHNPQNEICEVCGGKCAPSGVDGGTWVHVSTGKP